LTTTRLVLVRHAEPSEDVRGRCYGRLDVGLSERGREQAEIAAEKLMALGPAAIYVSPLRRARETAAPFAARRNLSPIVDERLREIDFGAFEGLTWEEARSRDPAVYDAWMTRPTTVTFPGGESWTALRERALAVRHEIVTRHAASTVALVTHGGVTRALLAHALGLGDAHVFRVDQAYGAISVVDEIDGTPVVRLLNDGWRAPMCSKE
jgi:alpha-ribazole phosphatase/probable phosphoglycerate mutase